MNKWKCTFYNDHYEEYFIYALTMQDAINEIKIGNFNQNICFLVKIELV